MKKNWLPTWCWEILKAGGEGDDRGWDGWMASLTGCTWVWASSRGWWWTEKPGVLPSKASQSQTQLYDWNKLNWANGTGFQTQFHTIVLSYDMWEQKHMWAEMWALCYHYFNWNFGFYLLYIVGKILFKWRVLLIKRGKKSTEDAWIP